MGRLSHRDERAITNILERSYSMILKFLEDETIPQERKISVAQSFALKHMPEKLEFDDKNALTREEKFVLIETLARIAKNQRNSGELSFPTP